LAGGGFDVVHEPFDLGEVSFHRGWTYHRAGQNTTRTARKVMTVIYMDSDMRLAPSTNGSKEGDRQAFCLDAEVGGLIDSPLTPVLWKKRDTSL
jgi:ectoine hydroxylase-related dioxygenase (phytanoyl-CoA dioxygenase family)